MVNGGYSVGHVAIRMVRALHGFVLRNGLSEPKDKVIFKEYSKVPDESQWARRGYHPHFDGVNVTQSMNFRLFGSVAKELIEKWHARYKVECQDDPARKNLLFQRWLEAQLNKQNGPVYLKGAAIAGLVESALLHFHGERYMLHAWVIMPNHVHTLATPIGRHSLAKIAHSWKSFTGTKANQLLGREGRFWDRDYFDRYIRNASHYRNEVGYIERNPVAAGLCRTPSDWRFSSAWTGVRT